jgi:hypothetical protein
MTAIVVVSVDLVHTGNEPGRGAAFLVLLAFLCSFGFIRTSARLTRSVSWWPGGVQTEGGVHLHHLVWGIVLLLVCGFVAFATDLQAPWWQITAVGFGIGAGFTLDEFALWVRLQDVYWSQEGRVSLDAVIMATVFAALVVLGVQPWGLDESSSILGTVSWVVITLVLAGITFMKGRILFGIFVIFIPIVGVWSALRLAKPDSPWGRHYSERKRARAAQRFRPDRPSRRLGQDFLTLIGGAPSLPEPPPPVPPKDPKQASDTPSTGASGPPSR